MPTQSSASDASSEATPPRRKRGRPRDPEADGRILAAASELMLQRGFDSMTVDEVASRAGVGKATVYRRWARKDDLAVAAAEHLYRDSVPPTDSGSLDTDLRTSYRDTLEFACSEEGRRYIRTSLKEAMRDTRIAALYLEAQQRSAAAATEMLRRAEQRGELRPGVDIDLVNRILPGLLLVNAVAQEARTEPADTDALVDILLHGISSKRPA